MRYFLAALILVGLTAPTAGQEAEKELMRQSFAGWDGLSLSCNLHPNEDWLQKVCNRIISRARFLSTTAKIKLSFVEPEGGKLSTVQREYKRYKAEKNAGLRNPLHLELKLFANTGNSLIGVYGSLTGKNYYLRAVNKFALDKDAEGMPKSGNLILWDKDFIASGYKDGELTQGVYNAAETILDEFFADYVEGTSPADTKQN